MSYDAIRYSFDLAFIEKQPMRTEAADGREVQTFIQIDWIECIPSVRIFLIS